MMIKYKLVHFKMDIILSQQITIENQCYCRTATSQEKLRLSNRIECILFWTGVCVCVCVSDSNDNDDAHTHTHTRILKLFTFITFS